MNVLIIDYPWGKTWLPLYVNRVKELGHSVTVWNGRDELRNVPRPDVVWSTWADRDFTGLFPYARHVLMMRRFEFFHADWINHKWNKISDIICCNPWIADQVEKGIGDKPTRVHFIPNPIDANKWTFKERSHGKKIGMVGRIHSVKNIPLAVQILMALPKEYDLHIAGESNDLWIEAYLANLNLKGRLFMYNRIPNNQLDQWWEDKNYCLCTSTSEGDPMFVLEAMAKGIKPIIHSWPGANKMYPNELVFETIKEAIGKTEGRYDSDSYLVYVNDHHGLDIVNLVVDLVVGNRTK